MKWILLLIPATAFAWQPQQINQNAYGMGVHSNEYGQPVRIQTMDNQYVALTTRIQQMNGYGQGVHADEYGRPVKTRPYR